MEQEQTQQTIQEILNKYIQTNTISAWSIYSNTNKKNNIYIQKEFKIETELKALRDEKTITITKQTKDNMSQSSFVVTSNITTKEFEEQLQQSLISLEYSKIKPYELPKLQDKEVNDENINYQDFSDVKTREFLEQDNLLDYVKTQLESIKTILKQEETQNEKYILNYMEILTQLKTLELETSTNINKTQNKESIYIEFVITSIDKNTNEEKEFIVYHNVVDFMNFYLPEFFKENLQNAKAAKIAKNTQSQNTNVILTNKAIVDFFLPDLTSNSVIAHASSRLKFMNMSKYEKGKEVLQAKKDKLTICSNPFIKNHSNTSAFDNEGLTSKKITILEDNIVKNLFGNKQFSSYLNEEPTGSLGVIEINTGNTTYDELINDNTIEIISFSSFVPDIVSGDFSAEIRLAYKYENGVKTPIKGGLFSANIFQILANCHLSKEELEENGYKGPKHIKFYECDITGL